MRIRVLIVAGALFATACTSAVEVPPTAGVPAFQLRERCDATAQADGGIEALSAASYQLAASAWTPPPPMPEAPPHRPDILAMPEPALGTTGDPRVDAYRAQLLSTYATNYGWRPYLVRLLAGVCADPAIVTGAEAAPQSAAAAVKRYLTPERIAYGGRLYREMQGKAPFRGGAKVPLEVLLAMWAVTSDYGRSPPRYDMLQAQLVRGAYRKLSYPEAFEVYDAARIILGGQVKRETALAYADGRIGQVRMLPSAYFQWARDGDGDGHTDIWRSRADILKTLHDQMAGTWESGLPILVEIEPVRLDMNDPAQARLASGIGTGQGVMARYFKRIDGRPWPSDTWAGTPITPFGASGPTFLITRNETPINVASPFRGRWEDWRGHDLPIAVGLLADAIAGRPEPTRPIR